MGLKTFFKNIRYLSRINLKDIHKIHHDMNAMIDNIVYELPDHLNLIKKPRIKNIEQTIDTLLATKASMCRFGDGELNLMNGKKIKFQKYDAKLSQRLKDICMSQNENVLIGINYLYYYPELNKLPEFSKHLYRVSSNYLRGVQDQYLVEGKQYYSGHLTQVYTTYNEYDFEAYFNKLKLLWNERNVTLICGDRVFNHIQYNIFDNAKKVDYVYAPSMDAFDGYDRLLTNAKTVDKDNLIIIILGPTAKPLAYDLALEGYQALDFGHIAKDYDAYRKKIENTKEHVIQFFLPD
jgi:glycosyltransferase family protein